MQAKLFITDLDGTALGGTYEQYARFPDQFSEFLDSLVVQGCSWGINTTWDIAGQWDLVSISKVKSKPDYLMAEFGLRLASAKSGKPEFVQPYTQKMEGKLSKVQHRKLNPIIHDLSGKFDAERIMFYGHLLSFELAKHENIDKFKHYLTKFFDDKELICQVNANMFSARPAFLSKGMALQEVMNKTQLNPDQVVIAGDELADIDMMHPKLATHYICPSNAHDAVKAHVQNHNGVVSSMPYGAGIIQAFNQLIDRE